MGRKTRGNYRIDMCMKFNCLNKDLKCNECSRYSEFLENNTEEVKEPNPPIEK